MACLKYIEGKGLIHVTTIKRGSTNRPKIMYEITGAAAYCYGSKRKVTDIDILVKGVDLEKAKAVLRDVEGVDVVADLKTNVDGESCLFFMDEEMEEKVQRRRLFDVEVPVIPAEDNVLFKAILQRTESQGKHDIEDVRFIIKNEKIDLQYLKKRMRRYHAEKRVKPLLMLLGILKNKL